MQGEAERFGCLEVDGQFELCRRLHRKICRLRALEDTVDIVGRAPKQVFDVGSVRDQAAVN
jgi:hypothetical protein